MDATSVWKDLEHAANLEEFAGAWLTLQCSMIGGCVQAVLALKGEGGENFAPVASWPEGSSGERLAGVLDRTLSERAGMLVSLSPPENSSPNASLRYALAYPVIIDDELFGAVAVEVAVQGEDDLRPAMEGLQWGTVWLENRHRRQQGEEDRATLKRMKAAVDILAGVMAEDHFDGAARAFVTEIATRLGCDRVSLGLVKGRHAQIKAISHTAVLGKSMNIMRSIGTVMDEALLQRTDVRYPPYEDEKALVVRDHELMAQRHGSKTIMTLPFYGEGDYHGALTLERQDDRSFSAEEMLYIKSVMALSSPVLENKFRSDRPIIFGVFEAMKRQASKLFGRGHLGLKLVVAAMIIVAVGLALVKDEYRLSANASLEGSISRSIIAPLDGYIKEASVRAGDVVKKDDVICKLNDRELKLEMLSLMSKRGQYERQYKKAMAERNRGEANVISSQIDQATAEINLVQNKLSQIVIRSPFNGVVLAGDLSQRYGAAVKRGEELFQIAPLDAYRLILKVDEQRITDVALGQRGVLVLSSLPHEKYEFTVKKITSITTAEDGRNYFRVEAALDSLSPRLRPGMEGVGKINVDRRLVVLIWTRSFITWLRLGLWSWLP
ncbi:MAG: histidine kinase [Deltaproteobacteria bacterium HGW-Deltaproteobacteria-6]|nr:MAG: histidine kinase [Deltaproteobacteria bacterium HGW-Deltaproteobacteria-6]